MLERPAIQISILLWGFFFWCQFSYPACQLSFLSSSFIYARKDLLDVTKSTRTKIKALFCYMFGIQKRGSLSLQQRFSVICPVLMSLFPSISLPLFLTYSHCPSFCMISQHRAGSVSRGIGRQKKHRFLPSSHR